MNGETVTPRKSYISRLEATSGGSAVGQIRAKAKRHWDGNYPY